MQERSHSFRLIARNGRIQTWTKVSWILECIFFNDITIQLSTVCVCVGGVFKPPRGSHVALNS